MFIPMLGGYLKKNQIQRIADFGSLKTIKDLLGFKKEWTKKIGNFLSNYSTFSKIKTIIVH